MGTQKNSLNETVLLSTKNICLNIYNQIFDFNNINPTELPNPDKCVLLKISTKKYVVGTQKNRLNETVLLSTKNI